MTTPLRRPARKKNPNTLWAFPQALDETQAKAAALLVQTLQCSPGIARILVRRGFTTPESVQAFRQRRLDLLHDPALLPDMAAAVSRMAEAIEKNQHIMLFGDYDVDGITATALMARFLKLIQQQKNRGFTVTARVPKREQGYGLSPAAVKTIRELKPDLLITLDNGSTAHAAVDELRADKIDVVIVDHHTLDATLPNAIAVVNPKRTEASNLYPFQELCGAALSFKLAWALAVHFSHDRKVTPEFRAFLLEAIALAATGTIADVVPLKDENRVLAWHGLQALAKTKMAGLRALLATSQIEGVPATSDVSFRIAPRINAAGRCADAQDALDLLLTDDPQIAATLAARLDTLNSERQTTENRILLEARAQAEAQLAANPALRGFILHSDTWHIGVVGIVASRIVEEFYRPALLLVHNTQTGILQGSGRSIRALNLHTAMAEHRSFFKTFGGHAAAVGASIPAEQLEAFKSAFEATLHQMLTPEDLLPQLYMEEALPMEHFHQKLCAELDSFEPCGMGNPRPVFSVAGVHIPTPPKLMGKEERHLQFHAKQNNEARRVIGFNMAESFNTLCDLSAGKTLDLAFKPQLNTWQGRSSVEFVLEAFRTAVHSS